MTHGCGIICQCTDVGCVGVHSICTLLSPIPIELQHSAKIDGCCESQWTHFSVSVHRFDLTCVCTVVLLVMGVQR